MMKGKVTLVGAGPGSAGLLTLRGKQVLEEADVVLVDRLVGREILSMIPQVAETMYVGKSSGKHHLPQHEINTLLIRLATAGKHVVRLKGGDPYLFGRGAEELEAVAEAGIPFEVVPGITSAIAVPAFAGIPVSHRAYASSVHIISAHRKNGVPPEIDYESLVKFGGTFVFLMGLRTIDMVTSGLLAAGLNASTPAALIENGTQSTQRVITAPAADIAAISKAERFAPPSLLVIGDVCALSEKLDWFSRLSLKGVRVIVTRPKGKDTLSDALRRNGADVIDFPTIQTKSLPIGSLSLVDYDWIVFTSPTGVGFFFAHLQAEKFDIRVLHRVKFAAVGEATAEAMAHHAVYPDYIPETYNAQRLAEGLPIRENSTPRILLFRAQSGTPKLASTLRERGCHVEECAAYQTDCKNESNAEPIRQMIQNGEVHFVAFTSASTVKGFSHALPGCDFASTGLRAVCIGEETAAAARSHGFHVLVSEKATVHELLRLMHLSSEKSAN